MFSPAESPQSLIRLRVQRTLIGAAVYASCWLTLAGLVLAGQVRMPMAALWLLGVGAVLVNAGFVYLIFTGLSTRWRDPSLTLAQMVAGIVWAMVPIAYGHQYRGDMLMIFLCIFFFGLFRLRRRQLLALAALVLLLYSGVLALDWQVTGQIAWERESVRLLLLGLALLIIAALGGEVHSMRKTLREQRQALERSHDLLSEQVAHDALTGVYNRRFLMAALSREEARARRHQLPFAVLMCDLDHFKSINDNFGHLAGDAVLRAAAETLDRQLRAGDWWAQGRPHDPAGDVLARYGGEEFAVLLTDCDLAGAEICAERLRVALRDLVLPMLPEGSWISGSFGVAAWQDDETLAELLHRADQALYAAKHGGRNRVVSAPPPAPAAPETAIAKTDPAGHAEQAPAGHS